MSVILETNQLCKFYGTGENQVKAVNHVNIQIGQGGDKFSLPNLDMHMIDGFDLIFPRPIKFAKLIRF